VIQGVPAAGAELTLDHNPLEAGLWHTVSFDKGCYVGQETIARLKTYSGVKQRLWGLSFTAPTNSVPLQRLQGAKLFVATAAASAAGKEVEEKAGEEVEAGAVGRGDGLITSVLALEEAGGGISEVRALGYVRVKAQVGAGDVVTARGEGLPEAGLEARLCEKRPFRSAESLSVHLVRNSVFDME